MERFNVKSERINFNSLFIKTNNVATAILLQLFNSILKMKRQISPTQQATNDFFYILHRLKPIPNRFHCCIASSQMS